MSVFLYGRMTKARVQAPNAAQRVEIKKRTRAERLIHDDLNVARMTKGSRLTPDEIVLTVQNTMDRAGNQLLAQEDAPTTTEQQEAEEEEKKAPFDTLLDGIVALVPTELVIVHTGIVEFSSTMENVTVDGVEQQVVKLASGHAWGWAYLGIIVLSLVIFWAGRGTKELKPGDFVRMVVPILAFILWTIGLKPSMLDGVDQNFAWINGWMDDWNRRVVFLIGAAAIVFIGKILSDKASEAKGTTV